MAEADRAPARLAAQRERIDQQLVEVVAVPGPLPELVRARAQPRVVELLELRLERVDARGHRQMAFDLAFVGIEQAAEIQHRDLVQHAHTAGGQTSLRLAT